MLFKGLLDLDQTGLAEVLAAQQFRFGAVGQITHRGDVELLQAFAARDKLVAAICVSPNTLANAGLLQGKQATVWEDEELIQNLKDKGANYTGLNVTIDGRIVTANGPHAAKEFGREIVELLKELKDKE